MGTQNLVQGVRANGNGEGIRLDPPGGNSWTKNGFLTRSDPSIQW